MVSIQKTDIRATLDSLDVSPPNTNLPSLDEKTISWVLNLDPAWMAPGFFGFITNAFDIGGGQALFLDDNAAGTNVIPVMQYGRRLPGTAGAIAPVTARESRAYQNIAVLIAGGVTNPLRVAVAIRVVGGANITIVTVDVPNPGQAVIGPILVPPGTQLRIVSQTGGALDTIRIDAVGTKAAPGAPLITTSSLGVRTN